MINKYYQFGKNVLFPINRSITGIGTSNTLKLIKKKIPDLKIRSFKSGKKVFDWVIPPEWNVKDAYVLDKTNKKIIDFKKNNLHLVGYSIPIKKKITKLELLKKLNYIKKQPNAIPYITSYYKKNYGFCVNYKTFHEIKKKYKKQDIFKINIDSSLNKNGNLKYGELLLRGSSKKEILISSYICHPSMANNELSGPIVLMSLINFFKNKNLKKSLRFLLIPETIGSIAYINKNLERLKKNIIGGYVLTCIGDEKTYSCMLSKNRNSPSDESLLEAYKKLKINKYIIHSYLKSGSDERQYNSPKVNLGITSIFRTKYEDYKEYHTSQDDFKLVTKKGIKGGYNVARKAIEILLNKEFPLIKTTCEPQLGKRGLYPSISNKKYSRSLRKVKSFIHYADGKNSLEKITKLLKIKMKETIKIYNILSKKKLII